MQFATNFGIYEIGQRPAKFTPIDDDRVFQVRARSRKHLDRLRDMCPLLGPTVVLDKPVDFQFRAYISAENLETLLRLLVTTITYEQFKKDAEDEHLHGALSAMWGAHLRYYPQGSTYGKSYGESTRRSTYEPLGNYPLFTGDGVADAESTFTDDLLLDEIDRLDDAHELLNDDADEHCGLYDHTGCSHARHAFARNKCVRKRLAKLW